MEKKLTISVGSCKRLAKEVVLYGKECEKQEGKIAKMKEEGKDEYEIRKQEEVLDESRRMIPDCEKRLQMAVEKLKQQLAECKEAEDDSILLTTAYSDAEAYVKDL